MTEITSGAISKSFVVVSDTAPQSPFEGQIWVDTSSNVTKQYKNSSWEKIQVDVSNIRTWMLSATNDIAENRHANNLSQENYDDMMYDPYVDSTKINTEKRVQNSTGTSGYVELGGYIWGKDGFEDGDISEWTDNTGSNVTPNVQTGTVKNGSYAFELSTSGDNSGRITRSITNSNISDGHIAECWMRSSRTDAYVMYRLKGTNATISFRLNTSGDIEVYTASSGSVSTIATGYSSDTWYRFRITFDITNAQADFQVYDSSGNLVGEVLGKSINTDMDTLDLTIDPGTTNGVTAYFDDAGYDTGNTSPYESGSITSTQKSLGFTPSKVIVNQDVTLNGEDIQYIISDDSGNSTTITQSEVGNEVSVNFASGNVTTKLEFSQSSGGRPRNNEYGVYFV